MDMEQRQQRQETTSPPRSTKKRNMALAGASPEARAKQHEGLVHWVIPFYPASLSSSHAHRAKDVATNLFQQKTKIQGVSDHNDVQY